LVGVSTDEVVVKLEAPEAVDVNDHAE